MPNFIPKDCAFIFVPIIPPSTKIINLSLWQLPQLFKQSVVTPLLKKPLLNNEMFLTTYQSPTCHSSLNWPNALSCPGSMATLPIFFYQEAPNRNPSHFSLQ